jgi:hypothetical protein
MAQQGDKGIETELSNAAHKGKWVQKEKEYLKNNKFKQ